MLQRRLVVEANIFQSKTGQYRPVLLWSVLKAQVAEGKFYDLRGEAND
jgi:hypothetical protein